MWSVLLRLSCLQVRLIMLCFTVFVVSIRAADRAVFTVFVVFTGAADSRVSYCVCHVYRCG